jgi:hypothetical protein
LLAHEIAPSISAFGNFALTARITVIAPGSGQAMKQIPHPVHPAPA